MVGMEVSLTPEQETQLGKLATERGSNAAALAREVLNAYLSENERFVKAVKVGEAALARGDVLTHGEVGVQVNLLLRS
jgi:predicted transcriptional regulator